MNCTFTTSCLEPLIGPVSAKLGTKHPFIKGIQVCLKVLFQCEMIAKKNYFLKLLGLYQAKFASSTYWQKRFKFFLNEEPWPLYKGT